MRYIAIDDLNIDAAWQAAADAAAQELRTAAEDARSEVLTKNAGADAEEIQVAVARARSTVFKKRQTVWTNLKDKLRALSHNKCWYCESIDPRSDNAVDHYRPKGNVKDSTPPHDGYWWLAFDWRNYRFSCSYCNSIRKSATTSGGKQDNFPLWDENGRARSNTDNINDEQPLLLDPTDPLHILLIAFADDGSVGPAATNGKDDRMARETITSYHLDHPLLVEMRAVRIREVRKWVKDADELLERYVRDQQPFLRNAAAERLRDILSAIAPKAMYSAAIKHLLAGMETRSDAAKRVLQSR